MAFIDRKQNAGLKILSREIGSYLNAQELNIQMCPFSFEGQTVLSASARTCTWSEYGISTHFYGVRVSGIVYQS